MSADKASESACPVDHKARDTWLAHARAIEASKAQDASKCPVDHHDMKKKQQQQPANKSWSQTLTSYLPWSSSTPSTPPTTPAPASPPLSGLETARATSSIPRALSSSSSSSSSSASEICPVDHGASANPSNAEIESGAHASGNWVYPSEKMFFDAMKRKGYDARETDMKTVVPIHNAVNERAWQHIREWEAPYLAESKCAGPRLESFANKNDRMTPTARLNTILGYTAPFDRHDWVIDRCGVRVDYVIDFYAGRAGGSAAGPSFYLDVRPKLNTWEGVRMRAMRWTGLV